MASTTFRLNRIPGVAQLERRSEGMPQADLLGPQALRARLRLGSARNDCCLPEFGWPSPTATGSPPTMSRAVCVSRQRRRKVARPERFERPTPKFVVWCSIQLSYGRAAFRTAERSESGATHTRSRLDLSSADSSELQRSRQSRYRSGCPGVERRVAERAAMGDHQFAGDGEAEPGAAGLGRALEGDEQIVARPRRQARDRCRRWTASARRADSA